MAERLPALDPETLDPERKRVFDLLASGRARGVAGPLMAWLRSPKLAEIGQTLGGFCRRETSLPERLSELAILTAVAFWKSGFQWHGHSSLGLSAGLDAQAIDAIRRGADPRLSRRDEKAVYAFVHELLQNRAVSEATFARALAVLDQTALVELIGIVGYYVMGAMTVKAFELDPGAEGDPFR
jgi:4-carboxymuconolactone decarboxylase